MPVYAGRYSPQSFTNRGGAALANTAVLVYRAGTTTPATLYNDRTKAAAGPNPFATDTYGNGGFWADPGLYDLVVNGVLIGNVEVSPDLSDVPVDGVSSVNGLTGAVSLIGTYIARLGGTSGTVAALPFLNVKDFGAVGDGVTDDTAAIQAAYDQAKILKCDVVYPPPASGQFYKLTAAIVISRRGQISRGTSPQYCVVKQTTAAAHGFTVNDDTDSFLGSTTNNENIVFENLRIVGLGVGTATGYGVNAPSDGDWFQMRNSTVYGFARGVYLNGWAQTQLDTVLLHYNDINLYMDQADSAVNTLSLINTAIARATTIGAKVGSGGGMSIIGGDWVEQPLSLEVGTGAEVTFIGGNFESSTGSGDSFISVLTNGRLHKIGGQFQKGDGNEPVGIIKVNAGLVRVSGSPVLAGFASTTPIVKKTDSSDVVMVDPTTTTNLSTPQLTVGDPGTAYNYAQFIGRADNAVPAASVNYRGLMLQAMGRDSGGGDDFLYWYRRLSNGTYQRNTLSNCITGSGSPEGVVTALVGVYYINLSGAAGTMFWVKESGSGNTGWVPYGPTAVQPYVAKTSSYALTASDRIVTFNGASLTVTLPSAVTVGAGKRYTVTNLNASPVTIATTSSQTINGTAPATIAQNATLDVVSDGANWFTANYATPSTTVVVATSAAADLASAITGHLTMNFPVGSIASTQPPAAGTIYGSPLGLFFGQVVTNIDIALTLLGTGTAPTLIKVGLLDKTGKVVVESADLHASALWTAATGILQIPLTAPYTVPATDGYIPVILQVGAWGTQQMKLGAQVISVSALAAPLTGKISPSGVFGSSQSDLPAVGGTVPTLTGATNLAFWFGVS